MKKFITGIMALTIAASVCSCGKDESKKEDDKNKIQLNDYLDCDFSGGNGYGSGEAEVDVRKLIEDNYKAFGLKKGYTDEEYRQIADVLYAELTGEIKDNGSLSNDDKAVFEWNEDNISELEREYSVKFSYSDEKFSVNGLSTLELIDPFEDQGVTFSGADKYGKASVWDSRKTISYSRHLDLRYELDKTSDLSNGDTVTLSVTTDIEEINAAGYDVKAMSKEYTVEGLDTYVLEFADIPQSDIDILDGHIRDLLNEQIAQNYSETEKLQSIDLVKYYFITPKQGINTQIHNGLYLVYKVDMENADGPLSYYYYGYYTDLLLTDGICSYDLNKATVPFGQRGFGGAYGEAFMRGNYCYVGYESLDYMYNQLITANVSKYNCEEVETDYVDWNALKDEYNKAVQSGTEPTTTTKEEPTTAAVTTNKPLTTITASLKPQK